MNSQYLRWESSAEQDEHLFIELVTANQARSRLVLVVRYNLYFTSQIETCVLPLFIVACFQLLSTPWNGQN